MTVLYLDDDPDDLKTLQDALQDIDPSIHCLVAATDQQAYSTLQMQADPPDHIFLDLHLPSMNGIGILKELKSHGRYRNIPVVMLSNLSSPYVIEKCKELGADFRKKPNSYEEWKNILSSILLSKKN